MKSLTKRNLLLVVLSLIVAVCSLTFAATVKPASAEETAVNNVTVMEAASVRVGLKENEYSGIRFRVILDEATKNNIVDNDNVQLGFIITPKYYFDKALEAKATAEAEDSSYDFLTEMKKDNPENFAEDKKHAYVGIAGEGLLMSNADEATKIYQYKGEWVASAAVENIKEANRDLQFTMIAYLKTDSTIEYFLPEDTTFSRAYLQTAHKSFMGGDVELDVIRKAQDTSFANYGTTDNPVKVSDNDDLYIISNAVAQGATYEGETDNAVFELANDVEVDHDFEPIGDAFAGSFKESNKKVIVYNNKELDSIGVDGVTVDNQTKLFNASERSADLLIPQSYSTISYVSPEELHAEENGFTNSIGYTGGAVRLSTSSSGRQVVVLLNETLEECKQLVAENKWFRVKIVGLLDYTGTVTVANSSSDGQFLTLDNVSYSNKKWIETTITLNDFYACFNSTTPNRLFFSQFFLDAGSYDFYLGDIEFVDFDYINAPINLDINEDTYNKVSETASAVYETSYETTYPEGVNNDINYTGGATKVAGIVSNITTIARFNYSANEYIALAEENNFNAVKFRYLVVPAEGTTGLLSNSSKSFLGVAGYGVKDLPMVMNSWTEHILSLDEFKHSFDDADGFTARLLLSYKWKTAENGNCDVYFGDFEFIEHDFGEYGFTVTEDSAYRAYGTRYAAASGAYKNEGAFTSAETLSALGYANEYTGNAVKITATSTNTTIRVKMNYTKEEYQKLAAENKWTGVKITFATHSGYRMNSTLTSTESVVGYILTHNGGTNLDHKTWHTTTLTMEEFYNCFLSSTTREFVIRQKAYCANGNIFYMGNIEFVSETPAA